MRITHNLSWSLDKIFHTGFFYHSKKRQMGILFVQGLSNCCNIRSLSRLPSTARCTHMLEESASKLTEQIRGNFHHDIVHYTRHGQLSMETGVYDMEHRSAQELFLRNERRTKLKEELEEKRDQWPSILNGKSILLWNISTDVCPLTLTSKSGHLSTRSPYPFFFLLALIRRKKKKLSETIFFHHFPSSTLLCEVHAGHS